ncbi:phage major capsid protein [Mycobacterium sp. SM3041]|uniref:phage major capsid protein n=1 Tax=Mycobacterium sp. SM3041 TaxID=3114291 RepID=UPI0032049FF7
MTMFSVKEPATYAKGGGQSYFRDLIRSSMRSGGHVEADERLRRHKTDVATDKAYRALDTTPGNGGHFVPPIYLVDQYVALARASRVYANLATNQPLPAGTNSINFPRMKSGTSVGIQAAENTPVASADPDEDEIEAKVRTIAGDTDVSLQLLEQSPVNYDEVIFQDLYSDYAMKLDVQTLRGTGAGGQMLGVHATPGIGTIAIAGGVTLAKFYAAVADAIQRVNTGRMQAAQHIAMHPRRWAWMTGILDANQRPLVVPSAQSPQNSVAAFERVTPEGFVGSMQGLPIALDPNIGTTYGAGNDEDVVYVQRSMDSLLYESGIQSRVLKEIGGKSLTVTLQVYGFAAFTAERYPTSIVEIGGLTAPVF